MRRRVGRGEGSEVTGQSRACSALWAMGVGGGEGVTGFCRSETGATKDSEQRRHVP